MAMVWEPRQVSEGETDPAFALPYIDIEEDRGDPVPHRYVSGGFEGTKARFSFYFPPEGQYRGRFFHNTYPLANTSDIGPFPIEFEVATGDLGFTVDSGAYYVQTNNGGTFRDPAFTPDMAAYRVNAAAARFSRQVAARIYGEHRPYGYLFGGSGGAYQVMGAAQNTRGVWDGFLPFVPGCNHAIPSLFTVRMHALRVLRRRDRFPGIVDALAPGGSGDPYAHLDAEEAAALREVTQMGFPLRAWYAHATMDSGYFATISGMIPMMDPSYSDEFWSQPGYLGSDPASRIADERFRFESTVSAVGNSPPWTVELAGMPPRDGKDGHLLVLSGASAGCSLPIARTDAGVITLVMTVDPAIVGGIAPGDRVAVDNSWALALQTYQRHQVPDEPEYYGWAQFRDHDGAPIYPQRPVQVGPVGTANAAGNVIDGRIDGKVLALACLLDIDAFPWQADWYRSKVSAAMGDGFADRFALYFIDNAHHENPMTPIQRAHAVSFGGALQQALRDLARWVEKGERPRESRYQVINAQVVVPAGAAERRGIQPVVTLTANGSAVARVASGDTVTFVATVEVPTGSGSVVSAEWDYAGEGSFTGAAALDPAASVSVVGGHKFERPGTYFPVVRVTSQREGDAATPYGRVQNIGRVRVVVE